MIRRLQATSIADRRENARLKRKAADFEGQALQDETNEDADEDEGEQGRLKRKKQSGDDADDGTSGVRRTIKRFTLCHALWILDIDKLTGRLRDYNEQKFGEGGKDRAQALARELRPLLPEAVIEEIGREWFKSEVRRTTSFPWNIRI
jgi:hypothetical protein